jgi:hypothetical protein
MDKQTKIMIAVGVAAVAGYYIYQKYYATPAATATALPSGGGLTPLPSTAPSMPPWSDPNNAAMVQYISSWVSQNTPANQSLWMAWLPSASMSNLQNLQSCIQYFMQSLPLPAALNSWWDTTTAQIGFH